MRAGRLRHKITIERRPTDYNSLGHEQAPWRVVVKNHPCTVAELTGRELERARQMVAEVTVRITTRRSPATEEDRIRFGKRIFQVLSVTVNEIGTEQTILCTEIKQ
jgi:SPP1 family predicted phage head-tail adaptor